MKRLALTLCSLFTVFGIFAAYSPKDIPNVHIADSTRWVSNPDCILTTAEEEVINSRLAALHAHTSVEFPIVVVNDIDRDINDFATELFRLWGIGKSDTNNGLLFIVSKEGRQMVFRTGSGVEGLLPDGLLGTLIRQVIAPPFKQERYGDGIAAAVDDITGLLSSDEARQEVMSRLQPEEPDIFAIYLKLCVYIATFMLLWVAAEAWFIRKRPRLMRYYALNSTYPYILFGTFLTLGIGLVALIPLMMMRHTLRRGKHLCTNCGTGMQLVDEVHDNDYLDRAQDLEEQIGAVDYDVWLCPNCRQTDIYPYLQRQSAYTECPVCHAHTMHVISDRTTIQPTMHREGMRTITRQCLNCGHTDDEHHRLPRKTPPVVIVPGGGFCGNGGGAFGGGSFGGGFTAGGGASGSW